MTEREIPQQPEQPVENFKLPKSLAEFKVHTFEEMHKIVREGEEMLKEAANKRRKEGKLLPHDPEMFTAVVYSGPSKSIAPVPAPVIK